MNTLKSLTASVRPERLLLGTHVPLFYPDAALGKVAMWETTAENQAGVYAQNALRLLGLAETFAV